MAKDKKSIRGHHRVPFGLGIRAIEYNLRRMWNQSCLGFIALILDMGEREHKLKHKVRVGLRYDRFASWLDKGVV